MKAPIFQAFAISAALIAGSASIVGVAHAQKPADADQTMPSPAPPPQPTPPPEKFHSPFNGDKDPKSGEAQDFDALEDLYKKLEDLAAALANARKCGTAEDIKKAETAFDSAKKTLDDKMQEYILGWSNNLYPTGTMRGHASGQWGDKFTQDRQKILDELGRRAKKPEPAAKCPPKPEKTGNTGGLLGDILGHVTIGVGVGVGGSHNHNDNHDHWGQEHPRGSGVSIGVGIGIGGGHHDDDDNKGRDSLPGEHPCSARNPPIPGDYWANRGDLGGHCPPDQNRDKPPG